MRLLSCASASVHLLKLCLKCIIEQLVPVLP
jgi:hypothetical protein